MVVGVMGREGWVLQTSRAEASRWWSPMGNQCLLSEETECQQLVLIFGASCVALV